MESLTGKDLEKMAGKHRDYMVRCRAAGDRIGVYKCPDCDGDIETILPKRGSTMVYDSLMTCPHCGKLHWMSATSKGATGEHVG